MIDCQQKTSHLLSLGAEEIDKANFGQLLKENTVKNNIPNQQMIAPLLTEVHRYYKNK